MTVDLELADRFVKHLRAHAVGEANAQTAKTIAAALDLPATAQSMRHLRACAQHAVKSGHLVCSSNNGYFYPATPEEVFTSASRLISEAIEMQARARRAKELAVDYFQLQDEPDPEPARPSLFAILEAP